MTSYQKPKMTKVITTIGIATNVLVAIVMAIILYNLYFPYVPTEMNIKTKFNSVNRGEEITLYLEGKKIMPLPVEAFIELVDGGNYPVLSYFENNPVGDFCKVKKFVVPNIKPGTYRVRWTGKYKVNCIREVNVVAYSNEFILQ